MQPKQGRLFTECPVWNVGKADPSVSAPVMSDVPVLILEGDLRCGHRARVGRRGHPDLKNSQFVAFPFTGHAVLGKSTCALHVMAAFLDDPTSRSTRPARPRSTSRSPRSDHDAPDDQNRPAAYCAGPRAIDRRRFLGLYAIAATVAACGSSDDDDAGASAGTLEATSAGTDAGAARPCGSATWRGRASAS